MGDWNRGANGDHDVLARIAALLLSLADLADRAAGLPFLRRRHVLGILGFGEAEARAFLIEVSTGAPAPADAPDPDGDAALLAARLRALALLLCAILAWRIGLPGAAGARIGRRRIARSVVRRPDAPARPAPDTS